MAKATLIVLLLTQVAFASSESLPRLCFGFSKSVEDPLRKPIALLPGEDNFDKGETKAGVQWAAARGVVNVGTGAILNWLLDHTHWKDTSRTKLTLEKIPSPHYLELHKLQIDANIFAFIWLHWTEEWAYKIVDGTPANPKTVLVSYQKVEGTDHIYRLCGSVLVKSLGDGKSDIALYEEAKAGRYGNDNMRELHVSNLFHLRQLEKKTRPKK